jgi:hypothetical protein
VGINSAQITGQRDFEDVDVVDEATNAGVMSLQFNQTGQIEAANANVGIDSVQLNKDAQRESTSENLINTVNTSSIVQANIASSTDTGGLMDQDNLIEYSQNGDPEGALNVAAGLTADEGHAIGEVGRNGPNSYTNVGINSAQVTGDAGDVIDANLNLGVASIQLTSDGQGLTGKFANIGIESVQLNEVAQNSSESVNILNAVDSVAALQANMSGRVASATGANDQINTANNIQNACDGCLPGKGNVSGDFVIGSSFGASRGNSYTNVGVNSAQATGNVDESVFADDADGINVGVLSIQYNGSASITGENPNIGILSTQLNDVSQRDAKAVNIANMVLTSAIIQGNVMARTERSDGDNTLQQNKVTGSGSQNAQAGVFNVNAEQSVIEKVENNSYSNFGVNSAQLTGNSFDASNDSGLFDAPTNIGVASIQFNDVARLDLPAGPANIGLGSVQVNDFAQENVSALNVLNAVHSLAILQTNVSMRTESSEGADTQENFVYDSQNLCQSNCSDRGWLNVNAAYKSAIDDPDDNRNSNVGINSAQINGFQGGADVSIVAAHLNVGVASIQFNDIGNVEAEYANIGIRSVQLNDQAQRSAAAMNLVNAVLSRAIIQTNVAARTGGASNDLFQTNVVSGSQN